MTGPAAALEEVNRLEGTSWRLVRKLAGGYQGGAFLLDPPAVLKRQPAGSWTAEHLRMRAALLDRARAIGYPTVRWLAHGALADGALYVVTDLAAGAQPPQYTDAVVDALLDAIDLQAELVVGDEVLGPVDASAYTRAVTFGGEPWAVQRDDVAGFSSTGARLVSLVDERCGDLAERLTLPTADLVHGDVGLDNALFDGDRLVALVDAQQVNRGTRAIDIAGIERHAAYLDAPRSIQQRIRDAGVAVAGRDVYAVCLASAVLGVLSFGTWSWPDDVDAAIPALERLLRSV